MFLHFVSQSVSIQDIRRFSSSVFGFCNSEEFLFLTELKQRNNVLQDLLKYKRTLCPKLAIVCKHEPVPSTMAGLLLG